MEIKKKSFKDINLKDYKKIVEISTRELDSDLEKDIAVLAVLCDCSEDDIYNMPLNELKSLLSEINWIKGYNYTPANKLPNKLKIDGIEYTINPDINKFTVAQYMDFQNFWDKRNEYMGNLLAVFIIPKGHKYNEGYDVMELADRLEEVFSLDDWNNVCFFFLKIWWNSIKHSLISSDLELKKMLKTKNQKNRKMIEDLREIVQNQINLMG